MKKSFFLLVLIAGAAACSTAQAALGSVSEERLSELEALHAKAEGQITQNDFPAAIRTYEDILLVEPDDETAYTNLGRIYMILGDTRRAGECFENALHINPENETALFGLEKIRDPDAGALPVA